MNFFQLCILVSLPAMLVLGVLVLLLGIRRRLSQVFFLLTAVAATWMACLGIAAFATTVARAAFWIRQCSAVAAFMPAVVNLLRLSVLRGDETWPAMLWRSRAWWVGAVGVFVACQTPWFLVSVHLPPTPLQIAEPVYGILFPAYAVYLLATIGILVKLITTDLRGIAGIQRTEMQFILLACCLPLAIGFLLVVIANILRRHEIGQALPLIGIAFNATVAYGLTTWRIMDAPSVVRRMIAFLLMVLYMSVIYFLVWGAFDWGMRHMINTELPLAHLAATLAVALSMAPLRNRMNRVVDNLFGHSLSIDLGETMKVAGHILNTIATEPELFERFGALMRKTLQLSELRILLVEASDFVQRYVMPPDAPMLRIPSDDPLVEAVCSALLPQPLVLDLIPRLRPFPLLKRVEQRMRELNAAAVVGIHSKSALTGIMLLGPRAGLQVYGLMAQNVLTGLSDQLAVALENAKLEQQIRRTDRLASLGTLSAGMAHEIKNPLVTVKTFAQLLPERYDDADFRATFTELVGHEIQRIDSIVNQLLHFSRPPKSRLRPVGLHDLVGATLRLVGQQLRQKGIESSLSLQAPHNDIMGDPSLLEQALVNILFNAVDAMERGGILTVSSRLVAADWPAVDIRPDAARLPEQIVLTIADTGPGIPPDRVQHVFDPFYTTKPQGTGLGLSIAHKIVQEHNGTIDVESMEGSGTAFHIALPVLNEEPTP